MSDEKKTRIIFGKEARNCLFEGLTLAAEAVSCTLGPRGKTVLIQSDNAAPIVTKDGVTVSKSIKLKDPVKRMGADLIKEAAAQTNDVAGDGTTTATVLTHAMVKEGLKFIEAGYSPKAICTGIEQATATILSALQKAAKQLTTSEEITQVGTISANGDRNIGELISAAMSRVGKNGIITVEDAKGMSTTLDVLEGMMFDRGYISPYFVTNSERMNVSYTDARVIITDRKISTLRELVPILEKAVAARVPLLIIAEDIEGEALQGLVLNRVNASLPVVAIKAPGYGKHRDDLLRDISIMTGAVIASAAAGVKLETLSLSDLGCLKKVIVDAKSTTLVSNPSKKDEIEKHVAELTSQLNDVTLVPDEIVKLKMRIAKLTAGVAVIRVGGSTEIEMIERKYRIEDALNATRAAAEEGIVPGGGTALFNAALMLKPLIDQGFDDKGVAAGMSIVAKACLAPIRKIIENAGLSPDAIISQLVYHLEKVDKDIGFFGYNAATDEYTDLVVAGVIDPVKVTRTALKNASSVAMTFMSLDAVIVEE